MYQSLNAKSGVAAVSDWMAQFKLQAGPDGLTFLPPGGVDPPFDNIRIPPRLYSWLLDLRVLRGLPLSYWFPTPTCCRRSRSGSSMSTTPGSTG